MWPPCGHYYVAANSPRPSVRSADKPLPAFVRRVAAVAASLGRPTTSVVGLWCRHWPLRGHSAPPPAVLPPCLAGGNTAVADQYPLDIGN
jgi:hypothetical protein